MTAWDPFNLRSYNIYRPRPNVTMDLNKKKFYRYKETLVI